MRKQDSVILGYHNSSISPASCRGTSRNQPCDGCTHV